MTSRARAPAMSSSDFLRTVPLFAGLTPQDLDTFLGIFQPVAFRSGECLVRQGQAADSAYILESGTADVIAALPGGGEVTVATLGPGSVLGEMALIESATRSATVVARSAVTGHALDRDSFRLLLAQRNNAAFQIQNRIARTLCARLRELNARILANETSEHATPSVGRTAASGAGRGAPSFDYRAFLPLLPVFRRFSPAEIDEFARLATVIEPGRGEIVFEQGTPSMTWYILVRGAVEISNAHGGRHRRIGILWPGRLCGLLALIEERPHSMSAAAREKSLLLELDRPAFDRLYSGNDRLASRFQDAVNQDLLQALARTNNQLMRLISQARIRGARASAAVASELQRVLVTQDCRAA
jgi:CRP-like cAMP-binding protein